MSAVPLFVELCAGTANLTYGLVGGKHARFPISRTGNKLGYRSAIYNALGLRHGQGVGAAVWVEADSSLCKAHRLLTTPEGCRAVAAVIRGWIGEDARALWERLRAEPVPAEKAEAVGAWLFLRARTHGHAEEGGFNTGRPNMDRRRADRGVSAETTALIASTIRAAREAARLSRQDVSEAVVGTRSGACWNWEAATSIPAPEMWPKIKAVLGIPDGPLDAALAAPPGDWVKSEVGCEEIADAAAALSALRWPPVQVVEGDVCGVEPRDVAKWLVVSESCFRRGEPESGFDDTQARHERGTRGACLPPQERIAPRLDGAPTWPPTTISNADVATVEPGVLPPGTVVYFDPNYQGTTGYLHSVSRAAVLDVARRWHDAGALVCVSEAEPLDLPGWHHLEITGARVGQKRTFGPTKEWLTMSSKPVVVPMIQSSMDLSA